MINKNSISIFVVSLLFLAFSSALNGATITGKVTDSSTNEALAGANVVLMGTNLGAASQQDGTYEMDNVPPGDYTLAVNFIGFRVEKKRVTVGSQDVHIDVRLRPVILKGQEVVVTANRAIQRETPIAFTDITYEEIEKKYWAQEIPLLLNEVPGVYAYSNTGGGLGYSEVKIRGFDATRVGVTVNDVPLNDPEDHVTYFYDLPDISSNIQDIQVQRGVGNSLYGTGALAGSVNLVTTAAGQNRYISYNVGLGDYGTQKHTTAFGSGLINNTYSLYGRFSKVQTDGYRDLSWVDSWSYYFSASRYDKNLATTVNLFGGPMRAHFAWEGITKEELKTNRTLNYDDYPEAADNFNQPHYQLINEWTPRDNLQLTSTLFHVKGDGYYEQYKTGRDLTEYNMMPFERDGVLVDETDLVRQKWVDKKQYGWIPRLTLKSDRHKMSIGAEASLFKAHHWGRVTWASDLPPGTEPNRTYYEYNTSKNSLALFVNELFELNRQLYLKFDLQYQHHTYNFDQTKMGAFVGHEYSLNYNFLTPRVGFNYNINPAVNVFSNFSMARREPKDSDIYDADDPAVAPLFRRLDVEKGIYEDPYIKAETLYDIETGFGYTKDRWLIQLNGYWMIFRDEIVPTGGITDDGYPIYGNAEKSIHRGVEAVLKTSLPAGLTLAANASYSDNHFTRYTEYLWNEDWSGNIPVDRDGNKIAGFPEVIINARLTKQLGRIYASANVQRVGRIYLDNSQTKNLSIDPYTVVNAVLSYDLPNWFGPVNLTAALHINNLLNKKYEVSGYAYEGVGYYIPAALRNYFFSLKTTL